MKLTIICPHCHKEQGIYVPTLEGSDIRAKDVYKIMKKRKCKNKKCNKINYEQKL